MNTKCGIISIEIALLLVCAFIGITSAATIYVPDDYTTIQAAVNAARSGDTVYVHSGTYYETVVVDKSITLQGEDRTTTIIDGCGSGNVVTVNSDPVNINGFTVQNNSGTTYHAGIKLYSPNNEIFNNIITNDTASHNWVGIWLFSSNNNIVSNNIINSKIDDSLITTGIVISHSNNNKLINNDISNLYFGIDIFGSSNYNTISSNTIKSTETGISLGSSWSSVNNVISNNIVNSNRWEGISLLNSNSNRLANNNCSNNKYGINLDHSCSNTIENNNCFLNSGCGIRLIHNSSNNFIYLNNFINKYKNVDSSDSTNIWNSIEEITYNRNTNTNYLGNYWSDYSGNDTNNDEIGDISYEIDGDMDNYPLMHPFENYPAPASPQLETPAPTITPIQRTKEGTPGFKVIFAISGLLAVAYLLRRRK